MAAILPTVIVRIAITASAVIQASCKVPATPPEIPAASGNPMAKTRRKEANAAALDPTAIKAVTGVGAPTPVTAFMAVGSKAAAFASFLRVFAIGFPLAAGISGGVAGTLHEAWITALAVIAILTMTVGNIAAIVQNNVKRMLAYSSIAHAGYALVGFVGAGAAADVQQRNAA